MITAILCAAGTGSRACLPENKVLYELNGLPVLAHSLSAFAPFVDEMIVACRVEDHPHIRPYLSPYRNARTVRGGATRMQTVSLALKETRTDLVIVHDAARPFVTPDLIRRCIESANTYGSGVTAIPAVDTVARVSEGVITDMPPRENLYAVQTPQAFRTEDLRKAYDLAAREGRDGFTDDSGIFAAYIGQPHIVSGDPANRKVTYPSDFATVRRAGFGVDTHAFSPPRETVRGLEWLSDTHIKLGGVEIPFNREFLAHSDGDVVCHALMDALLSAIDERDIGCQFPDYSPAYKDADSMKLLEQVMDKVRAKNLSVRNASISVLAERPRLSPYIEKIRESLRAALSCEHVAVAAGTNEKLGYVGAGLGITAYALVLLQ